MIKKVTSNLTRPVDDSILGPYQPGNQAVELEAVAYSIITTMSRKSSYQDRAI